MGNHDVRCSAQRHQKRQGQKNQAQDCIFAQEILETSLFAAPENEKLKRTQKAPWAPIKSKAFQLQSFFFKHGLKGLRSPKMVVARAIQVVPTTAE